MPLPSFLIAGERRCGSTSLGKWIQEHPDIYLHPRFDLSYFIDDELVGAKEWSEGHVDDRKWSSVHTPDEYSSMFAEANGHAAIGEKSADYLYWPQSHQRMIDFVPDIRVLITLRNPIARAWSHYWNEVGKGRETLDFEEALEREDDRRHASDYASFHLAYRSRGYYDETLEAFLNVVPREQVLVTTIERNRAEPEKSLRRVYEFIGVDPNKGLNLAGTQHNTNWTNFSTSKIPGLAKIEDGLIYLIKRTTRRLVRDPFDRRKLQLKLISKFRKTKADFEMDPPTRASLAETYRPHVKRLEEILGRNLTEWKL